MTAIDAHPESVAVLAERASIDAAIAGETLCSTFLRTARREPDRIALRERGTDGWREITWGDYSDRVARVAAGLSDLGVRSGDRVAMLMRNRPEFHYTDLAALFIGATPVSLYNSSSRTQLRYFLTHSRAPVVICDDDFADQVLANRDELPDLRHVVIVGANGLPGTVPFSRLLEAEPVAGEIAASVRPSDIATIIYTSGTTGTPKGVMLSHRNVTFMVESFARAMDLDLRDYPAISYLPMAHIAERIVTHYLHVRFGNVVATCPDLTAIASYMVDVRPAWWFCAPRMWEKLQGGIQAMLDSDSDLRARFHDAQRIGARHFEAANGRRPVPDDLRAVWEHARSEVIAPVLARFGLDQVKIAITGSAPMPRQTFDFFTSCGIALSDCYGQSESCGVIAWDPVNVTPGTSGRRMRGTELRIADDGEICSRGPHTFAGYLDAPERTSEAVDDAGWLHTGDLGRIDNLGNLHVVGRKKEIIVPTSGHNVSPVPIEAALKEHPLIGQACLFGDGRPHIVALLVPDLDGLDSWAAQRRLELTIEQAADHAGVRAEIQSHITAINERFARPEHVRAFQVLGEEWLPDTDVMTPTAKLKRRAIEARYADLIAALYG